MMKALFLFLSGNSIQQTPDVAFPPFPSVMNEKILRVVMLSLAPGPIDERNWCKKTCASVCTNNEKVDVGRSRFCR